ncbi:methyltransf_25 domain-containing protein, partial [Haematococcus lacustris]
MSAGRGILFELKSWAKYLLPSKYVAVYYGSPPSVVSRMLEIANCGPKDVVYDLGCGDGRVLIAAAQRGA